MSAKTFWMVDPREGSLLLEFHSKTPRDAALKAATRDHQEICLVDGASGKLHIFRGAKVPLAEHELTEFTRTRQIHAKPAVAKIAYRNMGRPLSKAELPTAYAVMRDML